MQLVSRRLLDGCQGGVVLRLAGFGGKAKYPATDADKVAIPADASLTLDWDIPYGGTGAAAYRYRVELAPGATLKVYEGGELVEEIATTGDHPFRSAVNHHFTFVAAGGTAVLSSFLNMGYLTVVDAKGRMVVTGASLGTTEVFPGESVTVDWTAKRTGIQTFSATVTGEGALTVFADGVPLAPADGVCSFEAEAGSVSRLEISFAGTGSAEVLKFKGPPVGILLLVR